MAKGGGQIGGQGGPVKRIAWVFIAACIAVAMWQGAFKDPKGFFQDLVTKAGQIDTWISSLVDQFSSGGSPDGSSTPGTGGTGGGGSTDGAEGVETANTELASIAVAPAQTVNYNRDDWRHWDNVGSSCWNVREEVLYRDAQPGSVTLLDVNKQKTTDKGQACYVEGGTWLDPYTGETFTNPDDLDIDHMVPLGEAARSGGQAWDAEKKRTYANYLEDSDHLLAVSASANRSKSDQTPETWKPANKADWCNYAQDWTDTKYRWQLTMSTGEVAAVKEMLATC